MVARQGREGGAQGRYAEAELLFKRDLAIREKVLGPEHPEVGVSLYGLALVYRSRCLIEGGASQQ